MPERAYLKLNAGLRLSYAFFAMIFCFGILATTQGAAQTTVWELMDTTLIGEYKPVVLGNPAIVNDERGKSLFFDGVNDGVILPKIPIEGWPRFTIEVLFKPATKGPSAPRFIHFQDKDLNRGTFELRLTGKGDWYMDTFLKNGKTNKGTTLIDSTLLHPLGRWYWAAMVYSDGKMTSYVNGNKELEGAVNFVPVVTGDISFGVRLNKVNWFKGNIKEIRFHPAALEVKALQAIRQ